MKKADIFLAFSMFAVTFFPTTVEAEVFIPSSVEEYEEAVADIEQSVYAYTYEQSLTGIVLESGQVYIGVNTSLDEDSTPYYFLLDLTIDGDKGVYWDVHTHPLHVFGGSDYSVHALNETERDAVCSGLRIPPSMSPSNADWQSAFRAERFLANNPQIDVQAEYVVLDPSGAWKYGIDDITHPFVQWKLFQIDYPDRAQDEYTFETLAYLDQQASLFSDDALVRDAEQQRLITAATQLGLLLQFEPSPYAYNDSGNSIPDCVASEHIDEKDVSHINSTPTIIGTTNQAPVITVPAQTTVNAGTAWSTLDLSVSCFDQEDGVLTHPSVTANPPAIPATAPVGTQITVQYECTDKDGAVGTAYSQVTVISASNNDQSTNPSGQSNDPSVPGTSAPGGGSVTSGSQGPGNGTVGANAGLGSSGATPGTGLVPCDGPNCEFCDFVKLIENVVDWLIGILGVIAAIMFIVSGLKLVTSMGDVAAKEKAKNMMINAAIGFMIVLAAWLLIDLFIEMLTRAEFAETWNFVKCVNK